MVFTSICFALEKIFKVVSKKGQDRLKREIGDMNDYKEKGFTITKNDCIFCNREEIKESILLSEDYYHILMDALPAT